MACKDQSCSQNLKQDYFARIKIHCLQHPSHFAHNALRKYCHYCDKDKMPQTLSYTFYSLQAARKQYQISDVCILEIKPDSIQKGLSKEAKLFYSITQNSWHNYRKNAETLARQLSIANSAQYKQFFPPLLTKLMARYSDGPHNKQIISFIHDSHASDCLHDVSISNPTNADIVRHNIAFVQLCNTTSHPILKTDGLIYAGSENY